MKITGRYNLGKQAIQLLNFASELRQIEREFLSAGHTPGEWLKLVNDPSQFSQKTFSNWNRKAIRVLDKITLHLFKAAYAATIKEKRTEIESFGQNVSREIVDFPVTVNGKFNLVPAEPMSGWVALGLESLEQSKKMEAYLWHSAAILGKDLIKHPNRLKICPYCHRFFWDAVTRPANQRICGSVKCKKEWNAERSIESYNRRIKSKSKHKPAAKAAKTIRRKK